MGEAEGRGWRGRGGAGEEGRGLSGEERRGGAGEGEEGLEMEAMEVPSMDTLTGLTLQKGCCSNLLTDQSCDS